MDEKQGEAGKRSGAKGCASTHARDIQVAQHPINDFQIDHGFRHECWRHQLTVTLAM